MRTRSDMETELLARLQAAGNSTLYGAARLTQLIQNAYIWATDILVWLDLVEAETSHTIAGNEYYDYPPEFKSGSIVRLEIDGKPYSRKRFEDYLAFKNNNPTSTDKIFASYGRQFFVWPVPTTTGTDNMDVWGAIPAHYLEKALDTAESETIFSNNKEICNEAIVEKAFSVAIKRTDPKGAADAEAEALLVLTKINKEEWATVQRDQSLQHPKFMVPDFYGNGAISPIGGFNYQPYRG